MPLTPIGCNLCELYEEKWFSPTLVIRFVLNYMIRSMVRVISMVAYFCVFEIEFKYRWFKCVIMYMCLCENYVCSIVHACLCLCVCVTLCLLRRETMCATMCVFVHDYVKLCFYIFACMCVALWNYVCIVISTSSSSTLQ